MGLPAKRRTPRSKRERAAHFALKPSTFGACVKCGAAIKPHNACPSCGTYRGKTGKDVQKRANRSVRNHKTA